MGDAHPAPGGIDLFYPATAKNRLRQALALGRNIRRQALDTARQAGFGINQELRRGHHLVAFLDTRQYFDEFTAFQASQHFTDLKPPCTQRKHDPIMTRRRDQRLARNTQRRGPQASKNGHPGIHVGLEPFIRVVEPQADPQRSGSGVEHGIDMVHLTAEHGTGQEFQTRLRGLPGGDPLGLRLEHLSLQPDAGEVGQAHDGGVGLDIHALARAQRGHNAVLRRQHANVFRSRLAARQRRDV